MRDFVFWKLTKKKGNRYFLVFGGILMRNSKNSIVIIIGIILILCNSFNVLAAKIGGGGSVDSLVHIRDSKSGTDSVLVGCEVEFEDDETILIPLQSLAVGIDYIVEQNNDIDTLHLSNGSREIIFTNGSTDVIVDGKNTIISNPVIYKNNDFYIFLEDINTVFSYDARYDTDEGIIILEVTEKTPIAIVEPELEDAVSTETPKSEENIAAPTEMPVADESTDTEERLSINRRLTVMVNNGKVRLFVDEEEVVFTDATPFIDKEDRTQIPVRAISEMLNCKVDWNQEKQIVSITDKTGKLIQMTIGNKNLTVGDTVVEMDSAALIKDDRTYIPLRFIAEALGLNVFWEWDD